MSEASKPKHIYMLSMSIYNISNSITYCNPKYLSIETKSLIGSDNYECLSSFVESSFDKQKELVNKSGDNLIKSLINAILLLKTDNKNLLSFLLPTLDGMLVGNIIRK